MDDLTPTPQNSTSAVRGVLFIVFVLIVVGAVYFFVSDGNFSWLPFRNTNSTNNGPLPSYSGSALPTVQTMLARQSQIGQFQSLDEVKQFLEDHQGYDSYYQSNSRAFLEETLPMPTTGLDSQVFGLGEADLKSSPDYSTTNVQVEGVDEADIVKTNGTHIYAISNQNVYIIDARTPGGETIVATIAMDVSPQNLYINGTHLVIYGYDTQLHDRPFYDVIRPSSTYTFFKVFDISDPANPTLTRDLDFEGTFVQSRMIGDYVYLVTSQPSYYIYEDYPLPMVIENERVLPVEDSGTMPCNCPDMYYIDVPYDNYTFTTVAAIDVTDATKSMTSDVYVLSTENIYVSEENLYIAYTKYINEYQLELEVLKEAVLPRLPEEDKARVVEIEAAPSYILSRSEKESKVQGLINRYVLSLSESTQEALQDEVDARLQAKYDDISQELEKTVIHKIGISEDTLTYKTTGEVTGHVLNQFSMDEHEGNLRIATTKNSTWSRFEGASTQSYNNVYVLDEQLKQLGKVEHLAKGEQIYSARFMQGRVYLVTFRQTDPLFVIDLSDPKNPAVLGELKVPGFSSYLHPFDEETLIGFGKQGTESGTITGLKLSLFDVSDVNNLREIDTYEMGDAASSSVALDDHKAFLFSKEKGLLVVPVSLRTTAAIDEEFYGASRTNGAMVFTVTKDGFEFRDRIDHSDGSTADTNERYYYGYSTYETAVRRSLYINDELYTLSQKYLKAHNLTTLDETASLELKAGSGDDFTIIR